MEQEVKCDPQIDEEKKPPLGEKGIGKWPDPFLLNLPNVDGKDPRVKKFRKDSRKRKIENHRTGILVDVGVISDLMDGIVGDSETFCRWLAQFPVTMYEPAWNDGFSIHAVGPVTILSSLYTQVSDLHEFAVRGLRRGMTRASMVELPKHLCPKEIVREKDGTVRLTW